MKNFFITSKRNIAAILTLCILLGIVGTCACTTVMAEEITPEAEEITQELIPVMASECPTYVPGIGWTGSPEWYDAIDRVQAGGHIEGWGSSGGIYLSESNARLLISAAGLVAYGGVERDDYDHSYPHIHYWLNNSRHNSIRVLE